MAASLNKVFLAGNLTRDPELKKMGTGKAVAKFSLAVNRAYTDNDGKKQDETCFVDVVCWNRLAEVCSEYLHKGSAALIEGRLDMHTWKGEDGKKRSKLEIVAQNIQFLGDGARADAGDGNEEA